MFLKLSMPPPQVQLVAFDGGGGQQASCLVAWNFHRYWLAIVAVIS